MDAVKIYWRDIVTSILKWAIGIYLLIAGWSIDKHAEFELAWPLDTEAGLRALGLIVWTTVFVVGLPVIVARIYSQHLSGEVDATVLPRRTALTICMVVGALTMGVVVLTAVF